MLRPLARRPGVALLLACLLLLPAAARADRRFFLYTSSPYLDERGEAEIEGWLTARAGRQNPADSPVWEPRIEFEYALHDRLSGAAYLNYVRPPGQELHLESPSLELRYRLAADGRLPGDPAFYLESTERGDELELESRLLLARGGERWMRAMNLVGEFEFRHDGRELLPSGRVLRNGFAGEVTGGIAYVVRPSLAIGLEARYRSEHPNFGRESAALLAAGPSLNLRSGRTQVAIGVLPQLWGRPASSGARNLEDFERVQARVVLGFEI